MKTPDVTPAQMVALATALLDLAVQFGVRVTPGQESALLGVLGLAAALVLGDAHIRHGRARGAAAPATPPAPPVAPTVPASTDGGI